MTDAQRSIVEQHGDLVGQIVWPLVKRVPRSAIDADDLLQAGRVGLCEAAIRWRPETGVPFGAFARRRIFGAAVDALRDVALVSGCRKKRGGRHAVGVNQFETMAERGFDVGSVEDVNQPLAARQIERLICRVPDVRRRACLRGWARGLPQLTLARVLGVSPSRVSQLTADALADLKKYIQPRFTP